MADVLIVADDLTGGNACAAGFARAGMRAVTVNVDGSGGAIADYHPQFDVVVAATDSRHVAPLAAAQTMRRAVAAGWPVELACARIDTTLRGNVGVAAQSLLDTVTEFAGRRAVGLCIPAHPDAGRVTVDGHQLLGGRRLEATELAHDVRSPMRTSSVTEILREHTSLTAASIPIDVVTAPGTVLEERLTELFQDPGLDVVVGDAIVLEHIDLLAAAAVRAARRAGVVLCGIDPGPGSLAIARSMGLVAGAAGRPILAVSGSSTDLTISQLAHLQENRQVTVVRPVIPDGEHLPQLDASVAALVTALTSSPHRIVLWASVLEKADIRELTREEAEELPRVISSMVRRVMEECEVDGLYTTGGDITASVLNALDARGIEVEGEVMPLAVSGQIVGGGWAGTPIVTKGGLIGARDGALRCIEHLESLVDQRRRWVRTRPAVHKEQTSESGV
jgi:uncharacterized protein YgbK (DUF1537 family)